MDGSAVALLINYSEKVAQLLRKLGHNSALCSVTLQELCDLAKIVNKQILWSYVHENDDSLSDANRVRMRNSRQMLILHLGATASYLCHLTGTNILDGSAVVKLNWVKNDLETVVGHLQVRLVTMRDLFRQYGDTLALLLDDMAKANKKGKSGKKPVIPSDKLPPTSGSASPGEEGLDFPDCEDVIKEAENALKRQVEEQVKEEVGEQIGDAEKKSS